ncbi:MULTISPECIES: PH domain-containing protein [Anaeromyxobacter]|uniref:PH domain-containing protein n=1 Tax=Anaeromyxobacter TaxID=161492 RepID=UPI001F5A5A49|nr:MULTISPECIES: PH domain-containing protein [unclassified Anaeromyxobacter]
MHRFRAPWDRSLRITTALVLVLIVAAAATALAAAAHAGWSLPRVALAALVAAVPVGAWALGPRGFVIGGGFLRIERNAWPARLVPLREVRTAEPLAPDALRGALRLLGTSGLFGHYGLFRSRALGRFRMYATRSAGLVLVRAGGAQYVLSPDRPEAFLATMAASVAAAPRGR